VAPNDVFKPTAQHLPFSILQSARARQFNTALGGTLVPADVNPP